MTDWKQLCECLYGALVTLSSAHVLKKLPKGLVFLPCIKHLRKVEEGNYDVLGITDDVDDLWLLLPDLRRQKLARKVRFDDPRGRHVCNYLVDLWDLEYTRAKMILQKGPYYCLDIICTLKMLLSSAVLPFSQILKTRTNGTANYIMS